MGIFDKIKHAIWGNEEAAATGSAEAKPIDQVAASTPASASVTTTESITPVTATPTTSAGTASASATAGTATASTTLPEIDVAAMLDKAVASKGQKLDWRHSIVDLMKAVGMDASLSERKELAAELHYAGDPGDSAAMNMFLHKALLKKLAENGGRVPADLLD